MAKAKKITVKMLKDFEKGKFIDENTIGLIFESAAKEAMKMKNEGITELPEDFLQPINAENNDLLIGIGTALCTALRLMSTDAAWKYIANDFIESFKEIEK